MAVSSSRQNISRDKRAAQLFVRGQDWRCEWVISFLFNGSTVDLIDKLVAAMQRFSALCKCWQIR